MRGGGAGGEWARGMTFDCCLHGHRTAGSTTTPAHTLTCSADLWAGTAWQIPCLCPGPTWAIWREPQAKPPSQWKIKVSNDQLALGCPGSSPITAATWEDLTDLSWAPCPTADAPLLSEPVGTAMLFLSPRNSFSFLTAVLTPAIPGSSLGSLSPPPVLSDHPLPTNTPWSSCWLRAHL